MKTLLKLNSFILLLFVSLITYGQTESTLNKEVEVIKAYQPSISDAFKIGTNPIITDTINYSPTFEYQIYSNDIPLEKNINHLPVVKLGNSPLNQSNTGYLKAGFGNALSPYGEIVINTAPSRKTDFGMQLFHFSSNPKIKLDNELVAKAPYGESLGRVFTKNYFRKSIMEWDLAYKRIRNNYYGFPGADSLDYRNTELTSNTLNAKQAQNIANTAIKIKNSDSRSKLDYNIKLKYDFLWNTTGQTAHNAGYNGLFMKNSRKYDLSLNTKFEYYLQDSISHNFDNSLNRHQYYLAELTPQISINKEIFELKAGFNLASMINADSVLLWNISPKIYFAYHPLKGILTLFAGSDGGFSPNNYQAMVSKSPYVNYSTDMKPSEEVISFYGGFKGKISRKLAYLFDVKYSINQNETFFYLTESNTNGDVFVNNTFMTQYDDLNLLRLGGNLRYSSPRFTLDIKGNYYVYDAKTLTTLSNKPDFDATVFSSVQITKRIKAKLDATLIGPRKAYYVTDNWTTTSTTSLQITNSSIVDLNTITDISLGAEYNYSKNINFFLNANNILNQNYQLWHGYNNHGLLVLIGGNYTF